MNDLNQFKNSIPLNRISIGTLNEKVWKYYDYGPKDDGKPPIIFVSPGTAEIYYKQFLSLCPRGHRVISVQFSPYDTLNGWVKGFERFLDRLKLQQVHLFGASLGGYLIQCFNQSKPNRVISMILCNTFCDTQYYHENSSCSSMFQLLPEFLLKRIILNNFPSGLLDKSTRDAVDFMVEQLEQLNHTELSSRLSLNCSLNMLAPTGGLMDNITIVDALDATSIPEKLREEVYKYYPNAKIASIKDGGDFIYLSRADELNLHIQVHLRRFENFNNKNYLINDDDDNNNIKDLENDSTQLNNSNNNNNNNYNNNNNNINNKFNNNNNEVEEEVNNNNNNDNNNNNIFIDENNNNVLNNNQHDSNQNDNIKNDQHNHHSINNKLNINIDLEQDIF